MPQIILCIGIFYVFVETKYFMGDIKNLESKQAIEKLNELADKMTCFLCTYENDEMISRPMSTQAVDEDGTIWFFSSKESLKNYQIRKDGKVNLLYCDNNKQHYLSLSGIAEVLYDKEKIHALWSPLAKAWFEEGENDPDITLIKIVPNTGHYWDTKNGKLISMIKIATAAITGKPMDGGVEGDLNL
jgi:general stress protein 26